VDTFKGETSENHSNYKIVPPEGDFVFGNKHRDPSEVILGIESSFDESAASVVNSFGEIKSNHSITQWEQWEDNNGIDPEVSF
jgi:hypothetical protein